MARGGKCGYRNGILSVEMKLEEVPPFYQRYAKLTLGFELVPLLLKNADDLTSMLQPLSESQAMYRYAEGKWSVKQVLQHIIDTERVLAYRSLCFARNDGTRLAGFDQDDYNKATDAESRSLHHLLSEFNNVRASSIDLFSSFSADVRQKTGIASDVEFSVEMLGYIISGHCMYHINVLNNRYFK